MTMLTVGSDGSTPIELSYQDHGTGRPVVLGGPHGITVTHPEQFTQALLDFLSS